MYTWNIGWIKPLESPWSIVNKFMLANQVYGTYAISELTTGQLRKVDLYRKNNIHTGIVTNYQINDSTWFLGDKSLSTYGEESLNYLLGPLYESKSRLYKINNICNSVFHSSLNYCPECLKHGEHMIYHQLTFLDKCLIHNIKLTNKCPHCHSKLQYSILFMNNVKAYQCTNCGKKICDTDFGELVEEWNANKLKLIVKPFHDISLNLIIITNDNKNSIQDAYINKILNSLFFNNSLQLVPKYRFTRCLEWDELKLRKKGSSRVDKQWDITEYAYLYAFNNLYRKLKRSSKFGNKINNVEKYINLSRLYKTAQSHVINNTILEGYDFYALLFYLWKRDLECNQYYFGSYKLNFYSTSSYGNRFEPTEDIMEYLDKINHILPNFVPDDYRFSCLVHISVKLMSDKFNDWFEHLKDLEKIYDKYEIFYVIKNATLRNSDLNYNKEFLLTIDKLSNEYQLYYE